MSELSTSEAAQRLGVHPSTVRRRLRAGTLIGRREPTPQGHRWVVILPDDGQADTGDADAVHDAAPGERARGGRRPRFGRVRFGRPRLPRWPRPRFAASVFGAAVLLAAGSLGAAGAPPPAPPIEAEPQPASALEASPQAADEAPSLAARPRIAPQGPDERLVERGPLPQILEPTPPPSVFEGAQVVSLYGYPGVPRSGRLGAASPLDAAREVEGIAAVFDALNGERGVIPALHLIVAVAHRLPGADGTYLTRLDPQTIAAYVDVARERGLLLFLDVQVGWAEPLAEVQRLAAVLEEPFVHVALDPEFATRSLGAAPGAAVGSLDAEAVNAVIDFLAATVRDKGLPPKILVLHQFLDSMLEDTDRYARVPEVNVTIDMDGFGADHVKLSKYRRYVRDQRAEYVGLKIFFDWDSPVLTPERLQALERPPDLVIYQ